MVYIPTDWYVDVKNENKVHKLISELNRDLVTDEMSTREWVIEELEKIGEIRIVEKLDKGEIPLGA